VGDQCGVRAAGVGESVAVSAGDAGDQAVGAQAPQVVADLAGGDLAGGLAEQPGERPTQLAVAEPGRDEQPEHQQGLQQGVRAAVAQAQPGHPLPGSGGDRFVHGGEGVRGADRVVAESLDAQQASVGRKADLPQRGQVGQPFPDPEVARVVDGGLGAQRAALLVILLDLGVLVVDVQARGHALGENAGAERAGGGSRSAAFQPPVEDQRDLIGAAGVEVVPDDLLEEHPPGHRPVQHLGQRELGLPDRDLIPVAGGPVRRGERVRQDRQPLAQQRIDLVWAEPIADPLQPLGIGRVVEGGEAVIQCGEPDPRLRGLALGPLVAVEAQLGGVREIRAELQEERAEVEPVKIVVYEITLLD
jgi:hypothetical protein